MANKNILIIDDDVELGQEIAEILIEEGYSVKNTSDPVQGQGFIDAHKFDVAILDYKLPGTTGTELLKRIKKNNPETKVFIVSGRPFIEKLIKEEKVFHLLSGIISKPFDCDELLRKIKE